MFMTTKRHQSLLDAAHAETIKLLNLNHTLDRVAAIFQAERDAARAELATLKASRARSNANLRPGNVRRKQAAPAG